ncbi:MAG: glycosyltransferase [Deltaproteobacteria bacterium]|nr:glycosyltransferase [Deltaproteobacteria bacterium]
MTNARFLFLHSGEFDPTVIDSQVVDSIVALAEFGVRFDMLVLMHGSPWIRKRAYNRRRQREIEERIHARVRVFPSPAKGRPAGDWLAARIIETAVAAGRAKRTVLHARGDSVGYYASRVAARRPDVRYVYDARGDVEAEFRYYAPRDGVPQDVMVRRLAAIQRHRAGAVEGASHVLCVSSVLRDRLLGLHPGDATRFSVIPCVADANKFHADERERAETRRELGLDDRFVVIFPGRFRAWHYARETLAVVAGLMRHFADVHFLVLTPDVEEARSLAREALPEGRYDVQSAPHREVPRYLRAADLGLLFREPHPLNEVACPTKFAEYMMSGLPVLISSGIGDCSPFVGGNAAGVVMERPDPEAAIAAVTRLRAEPADARRARIAALSERFSRQRAAREMAEIYLRLAGN